MLGWYEAAMKRWARSDVVLNGLSKVYDVNVNVKTDAQKVVRRFV
jgi:hypothetical protein